jgi:hypothetical protein
VGSCTRGESGSPPQPLTLRTQFGIVGNAPSRAGCHVGGEDVIGVPVEVRAGPVVSDCLVDRPSNRRRWYQYNHVALAVHRSTRCRAPRRGLRCCCRLPRRSAARAAPASQRGRSRTDWVTPGPRSAASRPAGASSPTSETRLARSVGAHARPVTDPRPVTDQGRRRRRRFDRSRPHRHPARDRRRLEPAHLLQPPHM